MISNLPWGSGDLTIDSSDNKYLSDRDRHRIYKYTVDGDLYTLVDSNDDSGTVDGIVKDAKIERPTQLLVNASGLFFTQSQNSGSLRKIDFINKLRIPAGQASGTFTLSVIDDGVYELDETINVVVSAAENIEFTENEAVVSYTLQDNDSAPQVSIVSNVDLIDEEVVKQYLLFNLVMLLSQEES